MKGGLLALILLSLALIPSVQALSTPAITFIPRNFSANSGLIAIADPQATGSTRVTWTLPGFPEYGLFPNVDGKYVCYFSNTDPDSNCGPSPFKVTTHGTESPYTFYVLAEDQYGMIMNNTLTVDTGGIDLGITKNIQGNTMFLVVAAGGALPDTVSYEVYDMALNLVASGGLVYDIETDRFRGNVTLDEGYYYLAVWGSSISPTDFGGQLEKITIGTPAEGGPAGIIRADSVSLDVLVNAGQTYQQTGFEMVNTGKTTLSNITIKIPDQLKSYLTITPDSDMLAENDSTFFTVTLANVQSGLDLKTKADIYSGTTKAGSIPLDITVSVLGAVAPPAAAPGLFTLSPGTWTGEYMLDQEISMGFTITNNGDKALTDLTATESGDLSGITDVSLPGTVLPGDTSAGTATVTPYSPGTYTGTIQIDTDSGSQAIVVSINVYSDITSDIDSAKSSLEDIKSQMSAQQSFLLSDTVDTISSDLDDAQSDLDAGRYSSAERKYREASAKVGLLGDIISTGVTPSTGPSTGPTEPSAPSGGGSGIVVIIIVIVLVALIGVAVWFYFTKMKGPGSSKEEEELEEEF